jgi:E3 ubiquitin-protein ligase UBR4
VTLGSQEGAFENVRMTYAGEQGAVLKQLVHTHALRRTSMCCLASRSKKHLIVSHEKGKSSHFTVLQLNALLKQDSNHRSKLTLTKLSTVPVPFTLVSVVANQANEDYVALTGLKDCCVMYLNESGQAAQEPTTAPSSAPAASTQPTPAVSPASTGLIVLHPALESANFIVKAAWLPGSRTELALVTADFVKIYDLSVDKISPVYYYLLPMGKVKDVTFVETAQARFVVIMSSCGYLYCEEMNEVSSARNGVYYVTNTIDCPYGAEDTPAAAGDSEASPSNLVFGGGVSVYYSPTLGLLFWSFQQPAKTFVASFRDRSLLVDRLFSLSQCKALLSQPLCNWSEVAAHPGLVMASTYISNNPVVLMFLPDKVYFQVQ